MMVTEFGVNDINPGATPHFCTYNFISRRSEERKLKHFQVTEANEITPLGDSKACMHVQRMRFRNSATRSCVYGGNAYKLSQTIPFNTKLTRRVLPKGPK